MSVKMSRRGVVIVGIALVLGLSGAATAISNSLGDQAASRYRTDHAHLKTALDQASAAGYVGEAMAPITEGLHRVDTTPEPPLIWQRAWHYQQLDNRVIRLQAQIPAAEKTELDLDRTGATKSLEAAHTKLGADQATLDHADLDPLLVKLDDLTRAGDTAKSPKDFKAVSAGSADVIKQVSNLEATQAAENSAIRALASDLRNQKDAPTIQKMGADAVWTGRNNATAAIFLGREDINVDIGRAYRALQKYADQVNSPDPGQAAFATAATMRYSEQIRKAVVTAAPKIAIISVNAQELWAYEKGAVVQDTLVITGRDALPSDVGPMKVVRRNHPWTMHSSRDKVKDPFWYPDTVVQYASWLGNTKVGIDDGTAVHDADWQQPGWFGPGGNHAHGSHGCINMPSGPAQTFYDWAPIGTPVVIIPGDGSPAESQAKQDTVDDPSQAGSAPKGI